MPSAPPGWGFPHFRAMSPLLTQGGAVLIAALILTLVVGAWSAVEKAWPQLLLAIAVVLVILDHGAILT